MDDELEFAAAKHRVYDAAYTAPTERRFGQYIGYEFYEGDKPAAFPSPGELTAEARAIIESGFCRERRLEFSSCWRA